jgi:hypothetical protein
LEETLIKESQLEVCLVPVELVVPMEVIMVMEAILEQSE